MVLKAVDDLGRLDLLVNNAGTPGTRQRIAPPELDLITEELWTTLLEVNLLGVFRCAKAAAPALKAAQRGDRQHRLDRRAGAGGQQPGLWRDQGRRRQPDAEPGARPGARGAGECHRARRGRQLLDGGMDE